jgi:hypothetical protein
MAMSFTGCPSIPSFALVHAAHASMDRFDVPNEDASAPVTSETVPITKGAPEAEPDDDAVVPADPADPDAPVVGEDDDDELLLDEPHAAATSSTASTTATSDEGRRLRLPDIRLPPLTVTNMPTIL